MKAEAVEHQVVRVLILTRSFGLSLSGLSLVGLRAGPRQESTFRVTRMYQLASWDSYPEAARTPFLGEACDC